jgi:hypothetical protein
MASQRPRPLVQGDLDGLCGIYSVVNSLAWALHTRRAVGDPLLSRRARRLQDRERTELFIALLTVLFERHKQARPIADGVSSVDLSHVLRRSAAWLKAQRGLDLAVTRPFYQYRRVRLPRIAAHLAAHLSEPGRSAIIGIEPPWHHWTVVIGVTLNRLNLFDSGGSIHMLLTRRAGDGQAVVLRPSNVFLLTIMAA